MKKYGKQVCKDCHRRASPKHNASLYNVAVRVDELEFDASLGIDPNK
jgi:hypothetical protein